jgi:nucleoid-associated protein YgaU
MRKHVDMIATGDNSKRRTRIVSSILICVISVGAGCNRMTEPRATQVMKEADAKIAAGDFIHAIGLYESVLDGSPGSAEVHYRLALLYDDKMNDPLHALHHFKRYLTIAPDGARANDVKNFMKRDELALLTNLSGDTVVPRTEAARLRNENLALRKQLEDERVLARGGSLENKTHDKHTGTKKSASQKRSYVVKSGDTLASISRKFYKTSGRWKKIRDANANKIDDPQNLKVGETLSIP